MKITRRSLVGIAPQPAAAPLPAPFALTRELELKGLDYAYSAAGRPAVKEIDIRIAARTTIGIVGGTGAGKTTLIDLILGLLTPQEGEIRVDGTPITAANRRAWQRSLGYVPQSIYPDRRYHRRATSPSASPPTRSTCRRSSGPRGSRRCMTL